MCRYTVGAQPELYTINPMDGTATLVGSLSQKINGLAFFGDTLYGLSDTELVTIDPATAVVTVVGALGRSVEDGALEFDSGGNIYAVI